jgi:hypothetical protein
VQFANDGFFVHFPYHPDSLGVLLRGAAPSATPYGFDSTELGRITVHSVKYTHHIDGECHFSQDNKIYTAVRTRRGRHLLKQDDGNPVFIGEFTGLEEFKQADLSDYTAGAHIDLPRPEQSITVIGRWIRVQPLTMDKLRNPMEWPRRNPDELSLAIGLAPPDGSRLDGSVLVMQIDTHDRLQTNSAFGIFFQAGFERRPNGLRFVSLHYPYGGPEGLNSIDLQRDDLGRPIPLAPEPLALITVQVNPTKK